MYLHKADKETGLDDLHPRFTFSSTYKLVPPPPMYFCQYLNNSDQQTKQSVNYHE